MKNLEFGKFLEDRTKNFAIGIIRLSSSLSNSPENLVIKNQITKSGTSVGANYREANKSRSKADFKNRISICQSETNETLYWPEIVMEIDSLNAEKTQKIHNEAKELLAIFTSIINKLNNKQV
ncbi:MAG: four helix bundle protein [Bacteroidales bacterium]|nr:four helix bundle protein [Bacteroidales bacterium]